MARQQWVIGNWKMNPVTVKEASELASNLSHSISKLNCSVAAVPGAIHLAPASQALSDSSIVLGAQNLCALELSSGAHTGEISAEQLKEMGVSLVLVGHSERRANQGEAGDMLSMKIQRALESGLRPVLCVGEDLATRESGKHLEVVGGDLKNLLTPLLDLDWSSLILAYEPIWAIGTGRSANPEDAEEMHAYLRGVLASLKTGAERTSILYGGSVKPGNAPAYAACTNIDGALVGGASLIADDFMDIARAFS